MSAETSNLCAPNLICIGIDSENKGEYVGRIWHQYAEDPLFFHGVMEMLWLIEDLLDQWDFPQRSMESRVFIKKKTESCKKKERGEFCVDESRIKNKNGDQGTFIVHVRYRQNATWQGEVIWADQNKRQNFRSALELIKLMDSALSDDSNVEEIDEDRKETKKRKEGGGIVDNGKKFQDTKDNTGCKTKDRTFSEN